MATNKIINNIKSINKEDDMERIICNEEDAYWMHEHTDLTTEEGRRNDEEWMDVALGIDNPIFFDDEDLDMYDEHDNDNDSYDEDMDEEEERYFNDDEDNSSYWY